MRSPLPAGREAIVGQAQQAIDQHDQFLIQPRAFTLLEWKGRYARARVSYIQVARMKGERTTISNRFVFIDQMVLGDDHVWRYAARTCRLVLLKRYMAEEPLSSHLMAQRASGTS